MDALLLYHIAPTTNLQDILKSSPLVKSPGRSREHKKTRLGLPITVHTQDTLKTVLACADTGAEVNIISDDLAKALGYTQYTQLQDKKEFALANGKIVEALGQIESICSFGVETQVTVTMTCMFYVLLKVATPVIMGMGFLEETKTMSEHRERLVQVPRPAFQALSVCSVNRPRKLLACELDHQTVLGIPDSGSEIDLISRNYAVQRGFQIYDGEEMIEMADGSIAMTSGMVNAELAIQPSVSSTGSSWKKTIPMIELFLLDGMMHDLIVGDDSLVELEVFRNNSHALIPVPEIAGLSQINRIRHLGSIDGFLSKVKNFFTNTTDSTSQSGWSSLQETVFYHNPNTNVDINTTFGSSIDDQRQNDRQEREEARTAGRSIGHWRCDFPGCTFGPFPTKYLMRYGTTHVRRYLLTEVSSHAKLHNPSRKYFCSFTGCPRSKGGKCFRRKSEMLRHSYTHPGHDYVCPFCSHRETKYSRHDDLMR